MDIGDLKRVNSLWEKVYHYLVSQIMEEYGRAAGSVLEIGPFSGGITRELLRLHPAFDVTIGADTLPVIEYVEDEIKALDLSDKISVRETGYDKLAFEDETFDLVIVRGAFFFLDTEGILFREIFRILRGGGLAFVGGGYGKDIPAGLITEIADESRELNDRLGRMRISVEELREIIKKSQLPGKCKIVEEGGLWVYIKK